MSDYQAFSLGTGLVLIVSLALLSWILNERNN